MPFQYPAMVATRIPLLLALALLVLIVGCSPMRFSAYTGTDTSYMGRWPQGKGTMAETSYRLPVYRGWPERPYRVVGSLTFEDANAVWDEGIIRDAVNAAKQRKGDAIVIRRGSEWGVAKIADTAGDPLVSYSAETSALVVRWLTKDEIEAREQQLDKLLEAAAIERDLAGPNRPVFAHVLAVLLHANSQSTSIEKDFDAVARQLVAPASGDLSGIWTFKVAVTSGSAISGDAENVSIGLARVTSDAKNVGIISHVGPVEMNFSGTLDGNRLAGQLGVDGISARCEGAASQDKISISFQTRQANGYVRGNVVLQRLLPSQKDEKTTTNPAGKRA